MKSIVTAAANNVELQALLLATIESYQEQRACALSAGTSVAEQVVAAIVARGKKRAAPPPSAEIVLLEIDPQLKMRRG